MMSFLKETQRSLVRRRVEPIAHRRMASRLLLFALFAIPLPAQGQAGAQAANTTPGTGESKAPIVITLQDALARAKTNDAQFRAAVTDLGVAHQEVVQSRAGLLPNASYNMQFIYTQGNGSLAGRFTANNGVHEYTAQGNLHETFSPGMFAEHRAVAAAEALARAKSEIAARGLVVTVVEAYDGYIVAQRKYATAQKAAGEAGRFLDISQKLQSGGEVANSDVIKARIQAQQQQRNLAGCAFSR